METLNIYIMDFKEFIENCKKEVFEETSIDEITEDAEFKYFDEWSSMSALTMIAMVEDNYNVILSGQDIKDSETLGELFELVKNKN